MGPGARWSRGGEVRGPAGGPRSGGGARRDRGPSGGGWRCCGGTSAACRRCSGTCGPPFLILASVLYALAFVLFPPPAPRGPPPERPAARRTVEARDVGEVDQAAARSRAPWISFELLAALMSPEDAAGLEWSPVETLEDPRNYFHSPSDDVLHDTVVLRYGLLRNGDLANVTADDVSEGCRNLSRVLDDYAERRGLKQGGGLRATSFAGMPLACVDVHVDEEPGGAPAVVASLPGFPIYFGMKQKRFAPEAERNAHLADGYKPLNKLQRLRMLATFLLLAVVPQLAVGVRGSFAFALNDIRYRQLPDPELQEALYANGTPLMLHAFEARTLSEHAGKWPEVDTMAGVNEFHFVEANLPAAEVEWARKAPVAYWRGGVHGVGEFGGLHPGALDRAGVVRLLEASPAYEGVAPAQLLPPAGGALDRCAAVPRLQLALLAAHSEALRGRFDCELTDVAACTPEQLALLGVLPPAGNFVQLFCWQQARAVLDIDGWGAAFSYRAKLGLDAVMVKIESSLEQEFEEFFVPGVHYLPASLTNLSAVLDLALDDAHAPAMREMLRAKQAVVAERLALEPTAARAAAELLRVWSQRRIEGFDFSGRRERERPAPDILAGTTPGGT